MALLVCYVAIFAQLNYIQVFRADSLNEHPENNRLILRDFTRPRGTISTAEGKVIARSVPSDDEFERQREYPEGDLFAHLTGFFSFSFGADGLEREYNDELAGQTAEQELRSFADLFVDKERTGNLTLSVRDDLQRLARDQLGGRRGSVVVIDPQTGKSRVEVTIEEGPRYRLGFFTVDGNSRFPTDQLRGYFDQEGQGLLSSFGIGGESGPNPVFNNTDFQAATGQGKLPLVAVDVAGAQG